MKRMSDVTHVRPWTKADEMNETDDGRLKNIPDNTAVFELDGPMFFATSDKFASIPVREGDKVVILRMRNVPALDVSAMRSLEAIHRVCEEKNMTLILSHVNEQPLSVMKKSGFYDAVGEKNFAENIDAALEMAAKIGK
ncbi:MAG: sodium-independent anion transporter [Clostridia bacterium]|nr:sodium-independent anion transporter [Clostridia bacterium]